MRRMGNLLEDPRCLVEVMCTISATTASMVALNPNAMATIVSVERDTDNVSSLVRTGSSGTCSHTYSQASIEYWYKDTQLVQGDSRVILSVKLTEPCL